MTEELLEKTFAQFGKLERVKKLKDYAFVHFEERDAAVRVGAVSCFFYSSLLLTSDTFRGALVRFVPGLVSFLFFAPSGNG